MTDYKVVKLMRNGCEYKLGSSGFPHFQFLLIGGGGSGGGGGKRQTYGAGGGAGGFIECFDYDTKGCKSFNVVIGAGGTGAAFGQGTNGGASCIGDICAQGGGAGGYGSPGVTCVIRGCDGGSGGGGVSYYCYTCGCYGGCYFGSVTTPGRATINCTTKNYIGSDGGIGVYSGGSYYGGGGGGAGGAPVNWNITGAPRVSCMSGANKYYAAGGTGGYGLGNGGCSCRTSCYTCTNCGGSGIGWGGVHNGGDATYYGSGGGGAGGWYCNYDLGETKGGAGCQGIAIIRYHSDGSDGINCATGGTVTTCGDYKIHTFTSNGTFCIVS